MEKFPKNEGVESEDALYGAVTEAQGRMSELLAAKPAEGGDLKAYAREVEEANKAEAQAINRWLEHVRRETGQ